MATSSLELWYEHYATGLLITWVHELLDHQIFKAWEGWDFVTAVYFSFITLSTIGFGDETPTKTFHAIAKPNANFSDNIKVMNFGY